MLRRRCHRFLLLLLQGHGWRRRKFLSLRAFVCVVSLLAIGRCFGGQLLRFFSLRYRFGSSIETNREPSSRTFIHERCKRRRRRSTVETISNQNGFSRSRSGRWPRRTCGWFVRKQLSGSGVHVKDLSRAEDSRLDQDLPFRANDLGSGLNVRKIHHRLMSGGGEIDDVGHQTLVAVDDHYTVSSILSKPATSMQTHTGAEKSR